MKVAKKVAKEMNGKRIIGGILCLANFAFAQSAQLVVLNKEGTLAFVDAATRQVIAKTPTGKEPHEVAVTEDGKYAVVSNYGSERTLSVIDTASYKEVHRADISPLRMPHGLFAADGKVYVTAEGSAAIGRYDPVANRIDWTKATGQGGTHMVIVSRDRQKIFATNMGSGSVTIFERKGADDWSTKNVLAGAGAEGFDLSPDQAQLWIANGNDGTISIVDVGAGANIATVNVALRRPNRLKFTPDGKRVLISDYDTGELSVIDVALRQMIKRIRVGRNLAGLLVEPGGARLYAAATTDNFVAVIDLATVEVVARIATGKAPDGMAWLPAKH